MKNQKLKRNPIALCLITSLIISLSSYSQNRNQDKNTKTSNHVPCENTITDEQVKNIYIGLKQGEEYKKRFNECLQASNKLNDIIIEQDKTLQKSIVSIAKLNDENQKLNDKITNSKLEIQRLQSKEIPIWKHPVLYLIVGVLSGVFIAK